MALRYLPAARRDIKEALKWSAENFGKVAAQRYTKLIGIVLSEIEADPELDFSYRLRGLQDGTRLYHLRHSRKRAAVDGQVVRNPRHFVVYTVQDGHTTIVRLLHDRMEISVQMEQAPSPHDQTQSRRRGPARGRRRKRL